MLFDFTSDAAKVFIGWDAREMRAWNVAATSLRRHSTRRVDVVRLALSYAQSRGLYRRPTKFRGAQLWDMISDAPMSTGHALARFLVPDLCSRRGWALFVDGDVLFRHDFAKLWALRDERYAVQVVPHQYEPAAAFKMDAQQQTSYPRKLWSAVVLWNAGHPAHDALTLDAINTLPGRELHKFCWLADQHIGTLPPEWHWLPRHSPADLEPALVHFTEGVPDMRGYEHEPYADEWYAAAREAGYLIARPAKAESA